MSNTIDSIMEKVQEYASTWASVGGPFDTGKTLEEAIQSKKELEKMIIEELGYQVDTNKAFAKLYHFLDIGQVLVTTDENEDGSPVVTVRFEYEGLDISPQLTFANTELGSEASSKFFEELTKAKAYTIASNQIASIQEAML